MKLSKVGDNLRFAKLAFRQSSAASPLTTVKKRYTFKASDDTHTKTFEYTTRVDEIKK
ncbi:MAG TPA: hypothetical protein VJ953_06650 [Saprospiraceae bacterium]|nr:hypothetical protein [Saprospiraceae bacterium]